MDLIAVRRKHSSRRLERLRNELASASAAQALSNLCIYATGSYARYEASEHSDIDLFFLHLDNEKISRLDELQLFAEIIAIGKNLKFPTFSNDGEFLKILHLNQMLQHLGGSEDDARNFFTARMLLLLESRPLVNAGLYEKALEQTVTAYFRDYPDHAMDFRPVFLINDIIRFWKTLCLNYEHRRNEPDDQAKLKQQVKNFKLKFSRLMTCFGTVVAICSMPSPIEKEAILELTKRTPLDRFLNAMEGAGDLQQLREEVLSDYAWFMDLTGLSTLDLQLKFKDTSDKAALFSRAEEFGDKVYRVLATLAEKNGYMRYLVI